MNTDRCVSRVSLFRINVRSSGQHKCHSIMRPWYQMMTSQDPSGIAALEDPLPRMLVHLPSLPLISTSCTPVSLLPQERRAALRQAAGSGSPGPPKQGEKVNFFRDQTAGPARTLLLHGSRHKTCLFSQIRTPPVPLARGGPKYGCTTLPLHSRPSRPFSPSAWPFSGT